MIYTETPRRKQIHRQVSWGHWYAFANILIATVISSVYLFSTPTTETPMSVIYMITTWLGHTSFIAFLGFVVLILPFCYQITNMRVLRGLASVTSAVALALLAFDALIYNQTGFHLSFSSAELLRSETQNRVSAFSWLQWFYFTLLFIVWLMLQLVIANAIYKRLDRLQKFRFMPYVTAFLVACFITSHGIHVWADARLYTPVLKQDNMFPLSYPATAKTLMARYGLIDLDQRAQQEELQFQVGNSFVYPPQPVYCSVQNDKKMMVVFSRDTITNENISALYRNEFHLVPETSESATMASLQYGIPANLASQTSANPVVTDLLRAFDVPVAVESTNDVAKANELLEAFEQQNNGLLLAQLPAESLSSLDFVNMTEMVAIILIAKTESSENYRMYSNFIDTQQSSSHEDIAPTVLREFGCTADVYRYSTGQALQTPTRNWLITSDMTNLIMFKYPLQTIVSRDGSYEVIDVTTQQKVLVEIDTNMLSRGIKHLENFANR